MNTNNVHFIVLSGLTGSFISICIYHFPKEIKIPIRTLEAKPREGQGGRHE
jgi:hypothetical protein